MPQGQLRPSKPHQLFPQQPLEKGKRPSLETHLARYIQANDVRLMGHEEMLRNQQAFLKNLEHQVERIAKTLIE